MRNILFILNKCRAREFLVAEADVYQHFLLGLAIFSRNSLGKNSYFPGLTNLLTLYLGSFHKKSLNYRFVFSNLLVKLSKYY